MSKYGCPEKCHHNNQELHEFCVQKLSLRETYTNSLYSFPVITISYIVEYLVAVKIYNAYFGKLVLCKCSEFINIYYCAMQHELLHRVT